MENQKIVMPNRRRGLKYLSIGGGAWLYLASFLFQSPMISQEIATDRLISEKSDPITTVRVYEPVNKTLFGKELAPWAAWVPGSPFYFNEVPTGESNYSEVTLDQFDVMSRLGPYYNCAINIDGEHEPEDISASMLSKSPDKNGKLYEKIQRIIKSTPEYVIGRDLSDYELSECPSTYATLAKKLRRVGMDVKSFPEQ